MQPLTRILLQWEQHPEVPEELRLPHGNSLRGKFVVLDDGTFLVGNIDRHALLVALFTKHPLLQTDVWECLREIEKNYHATVIAAGKINYDGSVSWGSMGFEITEAPTDQILKQEIEKILHDLCVEQKI